MSSIVIFIFLVAARFCLYQAHAEDKVGHHSEVKTEGPCKNEFMKYCLNSGDCYYLVDEGIVGCNLSWLCGGKRRDKYLCSDEDGI